MSAVSGDCSSGDVLWKLSGENQRCQLTIWGNVNEMMRCVDGELLYLDWCTREALRYSDRGRSARVERRVFRGVDECCVVGRYYIPVLKKVL